jgi:hypothetical protein
MEVTITMEPCSDTAPPVGQERIGSLDQPNVSTEKTGDPILKAKFIMVCHLATMHYNLNLYF